MIYSVLSRLMAVVLFCMIVAFPFSDMQSLSADTLVDVLTDAGVEPVEQDVPIPKVDGENTAEDKTNSIMYKVIEVLLILSGVAAVVLVVLGGVEYTISAGEEDRLNGGKAKIKYALLGLVIVIFSYAILTNAINFLEVAE